MHDGMPYGRNQGQGQGHSREVDRQSPTGLIFCYSHFGAKKTINTLTVNSANEIVSSASVCLFVNAKTTDSTDFHKNL